MPELRKKQQAVQAEWQSAGESVEECGGRAVGTEGPGLQLHALRAAEAAHCAEGGEAAQGAGSGTEAPDPRDQQGTDGGGTGSVSAGLDWLFREVRNALGATKP